MAKAASVVAEARNRMGSVRLKTQVGKSIQDEDSKIATTVHHLLKSQDNMTRIMRVAVSGRQMSPPDLIKIQAGVYYYTQELELTSKMVDRAGSSIKQTLNTQV